MSESPLDRKPAPSLSADLLTWWTDARIAAAFLTRLPIKLPEETGLDALARAARAFSLVGIAIGLAGGAVYAIAMAIGIPPVLAALVAVVSLTMLTGALHEDGLADLADGFGGGTDRDRKIEIMRDSRIGTYGVLALIMSVVLRGGALAALGTPTAAMAALVAGHAVSRALVVVVMNREALARDDGLAATVGRPTAAAASWAIGIGAGIALVTLGIAAPVTLAAGAIAAWSVAWLARRQIGGYTGDVLGATQQVSEITMLLAVVAQT